MNMRETLIGEKGEKKLLPSQTSKFAPCVVAASLRELESLAQAENPQWHWPLRELPDAVIQQLGRDPLTTYSPYLAVKGNRGTPDPVNKFLELREIPLKLTDLNYPYSLYSAAVLDVLAKWLTPGKRTKVQLNDGTVVHAVSMLGEHGCPDGVDIYDLSGRKVVKILTMDPNTYLLLHQPENIFPEDSDLFEMMSGFSRDTMFPSSDSGDYRGVVFPMVEYSLVEETLPELVGASFNEARDVSLPVIIADAKGYLSLVMNEVGAQARAAAALGATRGISFAEPLVINSPFVVGVIVNNNLAMVVPINKESMKDPGQIGGFDRGEEDPVQLYTGPQGNNSRYGRRSSW